MKPPNHGCRVRVTGEGFSGAEGFLMLPRYPNPWLRFTFTLRSPSKQPTKPMLLAVFASDRIEVLR